MPSCSGTKSPVECQYRRGLAAVHGRERGRVDDDLIGTIARCQYGRQNESVVLISDLSDTQLPDAAEPFVVDRSGEHQEWKFGQCRAVDNLPAAR